MMEDTDIAAFLLYYDDQISANALKLRNVLLENLPGIKEQIDVPAKMIAYGLL